MPLRIRLALIVLAVIAVLIQFVPVDRSNPPEPAPLDAPADVTEVLEQSCFDCHSNRTRWPWYAWIAPVSWLVAHDVHEAHKHLNFSNWGRLAPAERAESRREIWEEVSDGEMPLGMYTWLHRDAVLTESDRETLRRWTYGAGAGEGAVDSTGATGSAADSIARIDDRETREDDAP